MRWKERKKYINEQNCRLIKSPLYRSEKADKPNGFSIFICIEQFFFFFVKCQRCEQWWSRCGWRTLCWTREREVKKKKMNLFFLLAAWTCRNWVHGFVTLRVFIFFNYFCFHSIPHQFLFSQSSILHNQLSMCKWLNEFLFCCCLCSCYFSLNAIFYFASFFWNQSFFFRRWRFGCIVKFKLRKSNMNENEVSNEHTKKNPFVGFDCF